jgi:hypothetical protein
MCVCDFRKGDSFVGDVEFTSSDCGGVGFVCRDGEGRYDGISIVVPLDVLAKEF